eukprot:g1706.t1
MASIFKGVREYLTPVLSESAFIQRGVLTPQEFVEAGDQLVSQFPTWEWCAGDESRRKAYLPPDKQYLLTRNVPCRRRVAVLESDYGEEELVEGGGGGGADGGGEADDEGWLATNTKVETTDSYDEDGDADVSAHDAAGAGAASLVDAMGGDSLAGGGGNAGGTGGAGPSAGEGAEATAGADADADADADEYADIGDFEEADLLVEDDAALGGGAGATAVGGGDGDDDMASYLRAEEPADNIVHCRSYDISLTYDKYYQTPRVWLFGYDEERQPLGPEQIFEDIMQDYAKKTVTMEAHPALGDLQASVHPCQHAAVMKRIVEHLVQAHPDKPPAVAQYLFIFLKFIQSVIPTVDYDFTAEVEAGT